VKQALRRTGTSVISVFPGITLVVFLSVSLASCLSLETEFDLRDGEAMLLTMRYRMDKTLWELGVFDEDSPERSVPVARRDVEETALRYEDVSVDQYRREIDGETVLITVRYRVGSAESMQALWGYSTGEALSFDPLSGQLVIPLATGQEGITSDQEGFLREVLTDRTMRVVVIAPFAVSTADLTGFSAGAVTPRVEGNRVELEVPLAEILSRTERVSLRVNGDSL
jgi:hypothetical protein